jgi:hypothetical protein
MAPRAEFLPDPSRGSWYFSLFRPSRGNCSSPSVRSSDQAVTALNMQVVALGERKIDLRDGHG